MEQCICIMFYTKQRNHATEEHWVLETTYGKRTWLCHEFLKVFALSGVQRWSGRVAFAMDELNNLQPTTSGKHVHSALERSPIDTQNDRKLTNLNTESIRSTTYTDLDKRRVCAGELWIKICVMRKNSEGWRSLQILWMTPEIDLVLRMPSWLGVSIMIPRLKDTRQNGDHPGDRYQKVLCF